MHSSSEFYMPAEWSPHSATLLQWPENRETWPGERLGKVEQTYLSIIDLLHRYEPVVLLATEKSLNRIEKYLIDREAERQNIHLFDYPVNDVWARDCGPVFVTSQSSDLNPALADTFKILNWEFNAWGRKYQPYDDDNKIPLWFADMFNLPVETPGLVLEGGSIDVNGAGDLLTTESVLLNPNRNPDYSKKEIEQALHQYLGVSNVIWLKSGLVGDDTDGHIDDLSRFLNSNTILTMVAENPEDVNYQVLKMNHEILKQASDHSGESFVIESLPLPECKIEGTTVDGSEYVPASYANFYIANGVVLVPLYDERTDDQALDLFRRFFPDRDVRGLPCSDLVWGQGSLHCITQQLYGLQI